MSISFDEALGLFAEYAESIKKRGEDIARQSETWDEGDKTAYGVLGELEFMFTKLAHEVRNLQREVSSHDIR